MIIVKGLKGVGLAVVVRINDPTEGFGGFRGSGPSGVRVNRSMIRAPRYPSHGKQEGLPAKEYARL